MNLSDDADILPISLYFLSNFIGQRTGCILAKCRDRVRRHDLQIQVTTIFFDGYFPE